jgi:DNA-binding transcriptional LysR family regulator
MTLRHLRTFITVVREGSITAAAEKLNISQPAVSLSIREMETFYDIKLFERISRKLYITPDGKEIYNYSNRILTLFDEMNFASETLKKRKTVRVGAGIVVGKLVMPKLAKRFLESNEDIDLLVTVNNAPTIEQMIITNDLDIGIMSGTIHNPDNLERRIFQVNPLVVICNKDHPLTQKKQLTIFDLASEKFLLGEKSSDTRVAVENLFLSNNLHIMPTWESSSTMALINAAGEGLGISVLPLNYVTALMKDNIVVLNVEGLDLKRYINIVYHKQKHLSPAVLRFIEFCRNYNT